MIILASSAAVDSSEIIRGLAFSLDHEYLPGIRIDEMHAVARDALDGLMDGRA